MKVVYSVESIDARSLLVVIGIGASGYQIPSLTEQLYAEGLNVEIVLLVLPIAVIGDVEHTVLLHCLDDGVEIVLAGRNIFKNDTVFDALAVCQGIAYAEGVVEPRAESVLTYVLFVRNIVAVLAMILIGDVDAEHIPDCIAPVVEGAFG